jgi:hypothetical protein
MRRVVIIVIVIAVLAAVAGGFAYRWSQRGPSAPSTKKAVDQLHASSTVQPERGVLQPPAGVYVYDGTGTEHLSFLDTKQSQGPHLPGTVITKPNGCWTFTVQYNSYHNQTWNRCASGDKLFESGGTTNQRFDFIAFTESEHSVVTCAPPVLIADRNARVGASWPVSCTGESLTTKSHLVQAGTVTYLGTADLVVGNTSVRTLHVREDTRLSGDQKGTNVSDLWLAESDGLPIQEHHTIKVDSSAPAPINHVTYAENGSFFLTSLTPRK